MSDALEAPGPASLLGEARSLLELPRLLLRAPELLRQPRGRGGRVLVLPGYGAGDASTGVLRAYLAWLGHRPHGWGLGSRREDVPQLLPRVVARLESLARAEGGPIALIGWSRGGVLAREAARERPAAARRVITLGTPVIGGPKYTAVAVAYRRRGIDLDAIEAQVAARNREPLPVPVTAIYSRSDGVVAWRACIDPVEDRTEHVEVDTTHVGLGFSPEVFAIIAQRLARGPAA